MARRSKKFERNSALKESEFFFDVMVYPVEIHLVASTDKKINNYKTIADYFIENSLLRRTYDEARFI